MKLSVEDVKINNSNAVLKFKITDPLREKLQATTSEMILGGADLVGRARTGQGKKLVLEIKLKRGADIVVGTPGRIKDHTERHNIATRFLKQDKKTIDLVGNDKIKASNSVRPIALPCNKQSMSRLIPYTISLYSSGGSKICFTKTKDQASQFSGLLPGARALHGDIQQSQRKITLVGFRKGQTRGAGKSGVAIMLYGSRKSGLSSIEKQTGKRFEHVSAPQPNDIAKAVGMEAAEKIIQVYEYGEGDKLLRNCFLRQMVKENDGNSKTQVIGEYEIESFEKDEDLVLDQKDFETLYHHEEKSTGDIIMGDIIMGQSRISEDSAEKNNEDRMKIGQSCVEYENLESFLKLPLEDPCILAHKENESLRIVWRTLGLKIAAIYFSSYVVNTCKVLWIVNAKVETFELGKTRVSNLRPRNHETKSNRATNLDRERREHKTKVDERIRSGYPVRQGERICMSYRHTGVCVYETEGKEDFMETNLEKPEDSTKTAKKLLAESKTEKAQKGSAKTTTKKRLDKSVHSDAKKRNSEGGSMDMQIAKSLSKKKNSRAMKSSTKEFEQILKSHQKRNRTAVEEVEFNKSEHGEELVSKRANIWWSLDKKFYDGIIKSYKRLNKMHQVSYSDGDSEELNFNNLKKERWKIISDEEVSKFSRIHGKFRDVVRSVHSDDEEHGKLERKRKDTLMLMGVMLCMLERRKTRMHGLTVLKLIRCILDDLLLMILKRKKMGGQSVGNTVRSLSICFSVAMGIHADELSKEVFAGSKWLVLRYDILNLEIIKTAIGFAKQEDLSVSLILASFKMAPYKEKEWKEWEVNNYKVKEQKLRIKMCSNLRRRMLKVSLKKACGARYPKDIWNGKEIGYILVHELSK
ncbi:BnaC04g06400D [Brassica napus]|uniref:BnaC04g06400D protein n=1 Tax=Brassica napus TaxID=3708 RepID=A0A078I3K4_BRANA|nr:BnaC04g06400D [Brassica napus]